MPTISGLAAAPVTIVSMTIAPVTCLPFASNSGFSNAMSRLPASFASNAPSAASGVRPVSANCDAPPAVSLASISAVLPISCALARRSVAGRPCAASFLARMPVASNLTCPVGAAKLPRTCASA